jgi:hypothetical protein
MATVMLFIAVSCKDKWDEHYSKQETVINSDLVEVTGSSVEEYIQSSSELSTISGLFEENGIYGTMGTKDQLFTVLVYKNDKLSGANIEDAEFFAKTSVCDLGLTPSKLADGYSIQMWNGKYLAVMVEGGTTGSNIFIAGSKLNSVVQANNGFIYFMEDLIFAPKSMYEMLTNLGPDYSMFKDLVFSLEERAFDRDNSVPVGVDETGNTVYDSVFVTRNLLMDRYNSGGSETWNMRSEFYSSTMLVPSNTLIAQALENAYNDVQNALNRKPTAADSTKFKEWIVKSTFYNQVLGPEQLNGTDDIYSVSGYKEGESASTDGTQWKPTVQKVNTSNPMTLSNGVAYYITSLKIPNNVVIYRIKNRFYLWENCSSEEKDLYFKWTNLENPDIYDNGGFGPIGPWPFVAYKCLRAYPTADATANKLPVSVECTGIALNDDGSVSVALVPPGEYYLRMGFRSDKYPWRMNIYFNDELVAEGANPNGAHYDRTKLGYPEGYNWRDWFSTTNKSNFYDCDGMEVATVTVTGTGLQPVKFKIVSDDMTQGSGSRNRMIIYNWTLRPTTENY